MEGEGRQGSVPGRMHIGRRGTSDRPHKQASTTAPPQPRQTEELTHCRCRGGGGCAPAASSSGRSARCCARPSCHRRRRPRRRRPRRRCRCARRGRPWRRPRTSHRHHRPSSTVWGRWSGVRWRWSRWSVGRAGLKQASQAGRINWGRLRARRTHLGRVLHPLRPRGEDAHAAGVACVVPNVVWGRGWVSASAARGTNQGPSLAASCPGAAGGQKLLNAAGPKRPARPPTQPRSLIVFPSWPELRGAAACGARCCKGPRPPPG